MSGAGSPVALVVRVWPGSVGVACEPVPESRILLTSNPLQSVEDCSLTCTEASAHKSPILSVALGFEFRRTPGKAVITAAVRLAPVLIRCPKGRTPGRLHRPGVLECPPQPKEASLRLPLDRSLEHLHNGERADQRNPVGENRTSSSPSSTFPSSPATTPGSDRNLGSQGIFGDLSPRTIVRTGAAGALFGATKEAGGRIARWLWEVFGPGR